MISNKTFFLQKGLKMLSENTSSVQELCQIRVKNLLNFDLNQELSGQTTQVMNLETDSVFSGQSQF